MQQLQDDIDRYQKNVNFFSNYFRGPQEIMRYRSVKGVFLGVVKTISLATVVLPIIFGLGLYFAKSNLNKTESEYKKLNDLMDRVSKAIDSPKLFEKISNNDYIQYLTAQYMDGEKDKFLHAYEKGASSVRQTTVAQLTGQGNVIEVLNSLPKDERDISVAFGKFNHKTTIDQAKNFVDTMKRFEGLNSLTLDISHISACCKEEQKYLESFIEMHNSFESVYTGESNWNRIRPVRIRSTFAIKEDHPGLTLNLGKALIAYLKEIESLKQIKIKFMTYEVILKKENNRLFAAGWEFLI